jgi:hypothetical protein
VESCARLFTWDLVGFCVNLCDFRSVSSSGLRLSSLAMVDVWCADLLGP